MGMIETASNSSLWRGVDYYEDKRVITWKKTSETTFEGIVKGSEENQYSVQIDTAHPKRSVCTCPFAAGRQVVCKHMIALYFTGVPGAMEEFREQVAEWEEEEEEEEEQEYEDLVAYVYRLSKQELRERLIEALIELEEKDFF